MTADSLNPSSPTEETFPLSTRQQPTPPRPDQARSDQPRSDPSRSDPLPAPARPPQPPRPQPEEPIYAHLAQAWHREGRTVPGEPDLEWRRLTKGLRTAPLPAPRDGRVLPGKHRRDPGGQQP